MAALESHSSLPYQILLYLNGWYLAVFLIIESLLMIYKTTVLPYPTGNVVAEVFLLIFTGISEATRIFAGRKGNLTERVTPLAVSVSLALPSTVSLLYLMLWQTYVLRVEVMVVGGALAFQGIECGLALLQMVALSRSGVY